MTNENVHDSNVAVNRKIARPTVGDVVELTIAECLVLSNFRYEYLEIHYRDDFDNEYRAFWAYWSERNTRILFCKKHFHRPSWCNHDVRLFEGLRIKGRIRDNAEIWPCGPVA